MRVLLAEDEEDLNFIITQKLRSEGYSVDSCYDGEEALDALAVVDYDAENRWTGSIAFISSDR